MVTKSDTTNTTHTTETAMISAVELGKVVAQSSGAASASGTLSILHQVSFSVMRQEAVAIVGASGSGKSTLLGLLAGLDQPTSGRVLLAGQDLGSLDEDQTAALRGRLLGFVFQSFQLLPA